MRCASSSGGEDPATEPAGSASFEPPGHRRPRPQRRRELRMSETISRETAREAIARAESAAHRERWQEALEAYREAAELAEHGEQGAPALADALRGSAIVRMRVGAWQEAVRDIAESRLIAQR